MYPSITMRRLSNLKYQLAIDIQVSSTWCGAARAGNAPAKSATTSRTRSRFMGSSPWVGPYGRTGGGSRHRVGSPIKSGSRRRSGQAARSRWILDFCEASPAHQWRTTTAPHSLSWRVCPRRSTSARAKPARPSAAEGTARSARARDSPMVRVPPRRASAQRGEQPRVSDRDQGAEGDPERWQPRSAEKQIQLVAGGAAGAVEDEDGDGEMERGAGEDGGEIDGPGEELGGGRGADRGRGRDRGKGGGRGRGRGRGRGGGRGR